MDTLGPYIRSCRKAKKLSVRKLARLLGVSRSVVSEIEADSHPVDSRLLEKLTEVLKIAPDAIESRARQRQPPGVPQSSNNSAAQDSVDEMPVRSEQLRTGRRISLEIYASELQAIGEDSSAWESETGGDLFGIWDERNPIVYLATRCGPKAIRDQAHFRLDVEYLIKLADKLEQEWGLRYFGDWHSHHRIRLQTPSGGDSARITRVASKNDFPQMSECIVTFSSTYDRDKTIRMNPYAYLDLPSTDFTPIKFIIRPGISPIRQAMIDAGDLPEQQFASFENFPLDRIEVDEEPHSGELKVEDTQRFSTILIQRGIQELESIFDEPVEVHDSSFGHILVAHANDRTYLAFAINKSWPHEVLQANLLNRANGSSEELEIAIENVCLVNIQTFRALSKLAHEKYSKES